MDICLECLSCFLRQTLEAARLASHDIQIHKEIMRQAALTVADYQKYKYAPELGRALHNIVKKETGVIDPYDTIKIKSLVFAERVFPNLKALLNLKQDRIYWALKISASGNIIDAAINVNPDLSGIEQEIEKEFAICDIDYFKSKLSNCKKLLIIGDNVGETVFDRVLMEELQYLDLFYGVRSEAILNDVTMKDAAASGLCDKAAVISTGCSAPGLIIEECRGNFKKHFQEADIVISKGQGNYETLSEEKREIFFLLKAKCPVVADRIGVNVGDYVLKCNRSC